LNSEVKEVFDTLEKVFKCPACFMALDDERRQALDKIMETYAKNRDTIQKEMEEDKKPSKEELVEFPISLELKATDRGLKLLKSEMRVDGKKVGLKVAITNEACTWDILKLNVVKSLDALEKYRKEQSANGVKEA